MSDEIDIEEAIRYIRDKGFAFRSKFSTRDIANIDNVDIFLEILSVAEEYDYQIREIINYMIEMPNREIHLSKLRAIDFYGNDLEDLRIKALDFLTQGNEVCKVYLTEDYALYEVLLKSFVSMNLSYENRLWMEHPDCPPKNFGFMNYSEGYNKFEQIRTFQMFTEQYAKSLIRRNKSTSFLRYTYPHLLYSSQRIKTDMSMYRVPFSNNSLDGYNKLFLVEGITDGSYYLPVTRYSESPETGLYHDEYNPNMCGTFFYYEPESTTYLTGKSFLVAQTKCSAVNYLLEHYDLDNKLREKAEKKVIKYLKNNENNGSWERGDFKLNLLYMPLEAYKLLSIGNEEISKRMIQYPLYAINLLNLYAKEDLFDQVLCKSAANVGIDIVVLTRMVGSKQIVTEVLDTRSRTECFKNLMYLD